MTSPQRKPGSGAGEMGLNDWIPAFAGMTIWHIVYFARGSIL